MKVHFVKEKGGYPFDSDRFLSGAENQPLCKAMVDHDQQGIKTGGCGEVGDEVTGDLLERAGCVQRDGSEWGNSGGSVGFVLLAHGTALDVLVDKLCKIWPPEF